MNRDTTRVMDAELEKALARETTISEYGRAKLLIKVFLFLAILSVVIYLFFYDQLRQYLVDPRSFLFILVPSVIFVLYQYVIVRIIKAKLDEGKPLATSFKYLNQLDEVSFPTLVMVGMLYMERAYYILDAPAFWLYFIFIIFSALHLNFKLSLFTGIFSSIAYLLIIVWASSFIEWPNNESFPIFIYVIKALIFIVAGASAGFVAEELRKRIYRATAAAKRNQELESIFGQYVSKEVARELMDELDVSKKTDATIMFLDIRNFSQYAESHQPAEIIAFQNQFFSLLIEKIESHQGIVNQFLGDGVMATFGTPVTHPDHSEQAIHAGLEIISSIQEKINSGALPPFSIGIGLHRGEVVTGSIGNEERKQYSISGMPVIIAARIEMLTKKYQHPFLVSEEVYAYCNGLSSQADFLAEEHIKGYAKTLKIYKISCDHAYSTVETNQIIH